MALDYLGREKAEPSRALFQNGVRDEAREWAMNSEKYESVSVANRDYWDIQGGFDE